ncbi:MAG: hypothetical protein KDE22_13830, partial [Rhodobacterales bacterium]|nr:hypothetical protein [Rhodobacterales bacterium]
WWDARNPVRPIEPLPSTVFAWTGALHLGDPPPATPFLCKPGPEAPFVVPRLVADPRIRAVVSRLEVGGRPAFLIVYFARTTPFELIRANAWGTDLYFARDDRGAGYAGRCLPSDLDYDFDLVPWIRAGRVLWITPGDPTLTLRATVADCPFLGLPGRRYPLALEDGDVWDDLPAETAHG